MNIVPTSIQAFQLVLWGVIGTAAAVASVGFLTRYNKGS